MKVALVTGAAKGLGLAWCRALIARDYKVIVTARTLVQAETAAALLNAEAVVAFPKAMEVTNEQQLQAVATWVREAFGQLDLLVNNAGVNPKDYADKARMAKAFYLDDLAAEEMLRVLHVNSLGPLLVVKNFRSLLRDSQRPLVLNVSSWLGSVSGLRFGGHYGYVGSKNLLNVLNKSMALELQQDQIICVNVNPGWVQTDMGGSKATFTPAEAVDNMMDHVVQKVTLADTGKFLNYDGREHPW